MKERRLSGRSCDFQRGQLLGLYRGEESPDYAILRRRYTARDLADEGVVHGPDRIIALTANLGLCFQGGKHHNSASALGRSAADQILKRGNRGEIPVFQTTKFELVNLKAGKAPGLKMPLELLAVADEVIE